MPTPIRALSHINTATSMLSPSKLRDKITHRGNHSHSGSGHGATPPPASPTTPASPALADLARQYDVDRAAIIKLCFLRRDPLGALFELYITHVRVEELLRHPAEPPVVSMDPAHVKLRVLMLGVKRTGRVHIHKGRQNDDGLFQVGRTWDLDELSAVIKCHTPSGFQMVIGKLYYWETHSPIERRVFCRSIVENYVKYTGGRVPRLENWGDLMQGVLPQRRPSQGSTSTARSGPPAPAPTSIAPSATGVSRSALQSAGRYPLMTTPGPTPATPGLDRTKSGSAPTPPTLNRSVSGSTPTPPALNRSTSGSTPVPAVLPTTPGRMPLTTTRSPGTPPLRNAARISPEESRVKSVQSPELVTLPLKQKYSLLLGPLLPARSEKRVDKRTSETFQFDDAPPRSPERLRVPNDLSPERLQITQGYSPEPPLNLSKSSELLPAFDDSVATSANTSLATEALAPPTQSLVRHSWRGMQDGLVPNGSPERPVQPLRISTSPVRNDSLEELPMRTVSPKLAALAAAAEPVAVPVPQLEIPKRSPTRGASKQPAMPPPPALAPPVSALPALEPPVLAAAPSIAPSSSEDSLVEVPPPLDSSLQDPSAVDQTQQPPPLVPFRPQDTAASLLSRLTATHDALTHSLVTLLQTLPTTSSPPVLTPLASYLRTFRIELAAMSAPVAAIERDPNAVQVLAILRKQLFGTLSSVLEATTVDPASTKALADPKVTDLSKLEPALVELHQALEGSRDLRSLDAVAARRRELKALLETASQRTARFLVREAGRVDPRSPLEPQLTELLRYSSLTCFLKGLHPEAFRAVEKAVRLMVQSSATAAASGVTQAATLAERTRALDQLMAVLNTLQSFCGWFLHLGSLLLLPDFIARYPLSLRLLRMAKTPADYDGIGGPMRSTSAASETALQNPPPALQLPGLLEWAHGVTTQPLQVLVRLTVTLATDRWEQALEQEVRKHIAAIHAAPVTARAPSAAMVAYGDWVQEVYRVSDTKRVHDVMDPACARVAAAVRATVGEPGPSVLLLAAVVLLTTLLERTTDAELLALCATHIDAYVDELVTEPLGPVSEFVAAALSLARSGQDPARSAVALHAAAKTLAQAHSRAHVAQEAAQVHTRLTRELAPAPQTVARVWVGVQNRFVLVFRQFHHSLARYPEVEGLSGEEISRVFKEIS